MKWNFQKRDERRQEEESEERVNKSAVAPPDLGKVEVLGFIIYWITKFPAKMNEQILLCCDL